MELTPALKAKVEKAIQAALKDVKPRPAVDRLVACRVTGKYARYCQFLTEYGPNVFGVIYVGLPDLKVTVHGPDDRSSKVWAGKERRRRARQEARLKNQAVKVVKFDPKLPTVPNESTRMANKRKK
jgi:hypothetical protein